MDNNDLRLLTDYLADDLTHEEKMAMDARITHEPDLSEALRAEELHLYMLRAAARAEAKSALKAQLAQAPVINMYPRIVGFSLAVAAALALVFWIAMPERPSSNALAQSYLEPYGLNLDRGAAVATLPAWDSVANYYPEGAYNRAVPFLESLIQTNPEDAQAPIYLAACYSQLGQYAKAVRLLEPLTSSTQFGDVAEWNLALNYVLLGETAQAKPLLERISAGNHYRKAEAKALLEGME